MLDTYQSLPAFTGGEAQASFIDVTESGIRLPDLPCKYVKLSNLDVVEDLATAQNVVVFWGFGNNYAHQLFPGDTTQMIPVQNATQICARTRTGLTVRLYFSYYK